MRVRGKWLVRRGTSRKLSDAMAARQTISVPLVLGSKYVIYRSRARLADTPQYKGHLSNISENTRESNHDPVVRAELISSSDDCCKR